MRRVRRRVRRSWGGRAGEYDRRGELSGVAGLAAVRRLQVAADSAAIVAKRVAAPLLTVQHEALVHGLRLLDMPRIQRPSRDLASPPVDAASLVAGWENDDHLTRLTEPDQRA